MQYSVVKELNKKFTPCEHYTGGYFMPKRIISLLCVFVLVFSSIIGRCAYISFSKAYKVSDSYNSYTVSIDRLYTNLYDRKGIKLNNNSKSYVAVIKPDEKNLKELDLLFDKSQITEITNELSKGYPVIVPVNRYYKTKYINILEKITTDNQCAKHLIKKEYGGLEQYVSKEIGSLSVNYSIDANGRILSGDCDTIINDNYDSVDGIMISLDYDIQKIAEQVCEGLHLGSVVVMESDTSRILASVSKGDDYINRAISPYAIGSIFKIIVCACALENDVNSVYICNGTAKVGDSKFSCLKGKKHGFQNMKQALANSCNCYFLNLALRLGEDKIIKTAKSFGFGDDIEIYKGWNISGGYFPKKSDFNTKGQLALIGFGQGKMTDSPVHFASALSCIANGGIYNAPTLEFKDDKGKQVISKETSVILKDYLKSVVTQGTGVAANYKDNTAGKTATAQSGVFQDGKEILNTWFAGFYPYDNPKYTIVVMRENGTSGSEDCCPIFRTIVEKLDKM